ncbi:MAG: flagellar basal body rod protein FlgB [Verrucomicrobiota bacterium]
MKKMLDVAHRKHQAIAGNLANVETPGYKRQDIRADFASELQRAAKVNNVEAIQKLDASMELDLKSPAVRPDGNNVQIDKELLEMTKNATEYRFLSQYASTSLGRLKTAITGRVS